ncbi:ABC transporter permease [Nocardioides nitrophenolicus]|uniref:ABC transporter permease n=1 Tax=Nocardioides nitrophenolicus TaxID=60489 RepID=UPI00195C59B0|nr:ABC transporter permease [Nocardioides nitrophenolicus]MBM7516998.1 simple sugar transport system permease protein [Nocardioides nitrophenolicus]
MSTEVSEPTATQGGPPVPPSPTGADAATERLLGSLRSGARPAAEQVLAFLVFLALGISVGLLLGWATGHDPGVILRNLFEGSIGSTISIGYLLTAAAPLLLVAVGAVICMRAGQFNIGQEGQVTLGAIGAGFVVFHVDASGPLTIVLGFVAAALAGAAWALLAALLKFTRGVDIVVSSLLLVFLAEQLLTGLISGDGPLHDKGDAGSLGAGTASQSPRVPEKAMLPTIHVLGVDVPFAFVLALVAAVLVAWFLSSAHAGYRLRILGQNPTVAGTIGISAPRLGSLAVAASGAFAGAAGAAILMGQSFQLNPGVSSSIGWSGLLIALAARTNAGVSVLLALVFGAMVAGGGLLGGDGVPVDIVNVITAAIVVALLCPPVLLAALRRRRIRRAVEA